MNKKIETIDAMRKLSEDFIFRSIGLDEFLKQMGSYLGTEFDPLDQEVEELDEKLKKEVIFYSKYTGGEFDEHDDLIPKNKNWKYGENDKQCGWIDKDKYKEVYRKEYQKIRNI